jgi:hypothetical protein
MLTRGGPAGRREVLGRGDVRVCDYVDLPLAELVGRLTGSDGPGMLRSALASTFGTDDPGTDVMVGSTSSFGRRVATTELAWRATPRSGAALSGRATLTAVAVQTGRHARTELLVTLDSAGHSRDDVVAATRAFLDELTDRVSEARLAG